MTDHKRFQWDLERDVEVSQCLFCRHWVPGSTCVAFPDGIPLAILNNDVDHRLPMVGDRGVQFAPRTPKDVEKIDELFADRGSPNGEYLLHESLVPRD
jgi:hypothetical protein